MSLKRGGERAVIKQIINGSFKKMTFLFLLIVFVFMLPACGKPDEKEAHKQVENFIYDLYGGDLYDFDKKNVEVKELKENTFRVIGMYTAKDYGKAKATVIYSVDAIYNPETKEWKFENIESHDAANYNN
ncbi:hypothetical protein PQS30_22980 [Bacillus licheniformis]|uniref:hypothetical protein n=1 Tax=Bacillus licheniformis TaxID=1402 RepID=UPI003978F280